MSSEARRIGITHCHCYSIKFFGNTGACHGDKQRCWHRAFHDDSLIDQQHTASVTYIKVRHALAFDPLALEASCSAG